MAHSLDTDGPCGLREIRDLPGAIAAGFAVSRIRIAAAAPGANARELIAGTEVFASESLAHWHRGRQSGQARDVACYVAADAVVSGAGQIWLGGRLVTSPDIMPPYVFQALGIADGGAVAHLPMACRPGIRAAGLIYAEIGRALARNGYDSITWRAHVPARRKLALLARSVAAVVSKNLATGSAPALAASRYLVDAASTPAPRYAQAPRLGPIDARVHWVFDLFERLQQQELGTP